MFSLAVAALFAGCGTAPVRPPPVTRRAPGSPNPQTPPLATLDEILANDPDPRRNELVLIALSQLGVPYAWGGARPEVGFDCSGLVSYVYWQAMRVALPRTAWEQARAGRTLAPNDLRPADLVFFNTLRRQYSHVGLYLGEDRFVHAPATGGAVRIESLQLGYWRERFDGARRMVV